jgi:hypothetical protein
MELSSKFSEAWSQWSESIESQVWYQQIKSKWEELDPQSRRYLQWTGAGLGALALLSSIIGMSWSLRKMRLDLAEREEIIQLIQTANTELAQIKESGAAQFLNESGGEWPAYFSLIAQRLSITDAQLKILEEPSDQETLIKVTLSKVNVKQLVRFAIQTENSTRPVKLRNISVLAEPDESGYLNATLALSGFNPGK